MRANAATGGIVATLSGTLTRDNAKPIRVFTDEVGAIGSINLYASTDGGSSFTSIGAPAAGVPVPVPGLAGTSVAFSAGSTTAGPLPQWDATCAQLTDQSGNGNDALAPTVAKQPIIELGLNGKPGLVFNVSQLVSLTFQPPAGAMLYTVYRYDLSQAAGYVTDGNPADKRLLYQSGTANGNTAVFNGALLAGGILPIGSFGRVAAGMNGAASSLKVGAQPQVFGDIGAAPDSAGRVIGSRADGVQSGRFTLLAFIWAPSAPFAAADAALNTSQGYGPGSILV